ncbi:MAG TPA: arylsulfatase [Terriglobales bacterium]|nr:arylsulfatase [Terriglobales bacterium]
MTQTMNHPSKYYGLSLLTTAAAMFAAVPASGQQINGTPGSPSTTVTIDGTRIPPPPMPFGGMIKESYLDSTPYWPPRVVPPKGAPNILLIMTDDQGYGVSSTFGGVIPTPALDRIAKTGLRYTQFHSTALCSPTRAALITGRNHHSVGTGVIGELSTGYPGYDSVIGVENATIGSILKENGYATSWFGKNHNTPSFQYSVVGPFDQWPSGMGFDYFYGFVGGETDQWTPYLFRDHTQIFPWIGKPGYNLTTDLADEAIKHMRDLNAAAPDKPFFVYYVPGGTHSPHQPTKEWIEKFKGKFDTGYEELRERVFVNQKQLGVIPADTQLTPWPDGQAEYASAKLPRWDSLSLLQKKLDAREAEVFAAYVAYTDNEIGRVIQEVENEGKLDNTIIIYICGDNGTSAEGTLYGTYNQLTAFNGILDVPEPLQLLHYESWGSDKTYPHMAVQWAWAFDTPFKWTKQIASHFGGTRQGLAISWPGHITDAGGIRTQFHHVIDIMPTILEATSIKAPEEVNGIKQKPIEGVSMAYTFDKANANVPSKRDTQYFELGGNRGIYHDGWMANTAPPSAVWELATGKLPDLATGYQWELYHIADDYSQNNDLAAKNPDKLKELQALFLTEAAKYNVFPLDNRAFVRLQTPRPSAVAGKTVFTYTGENAGIPLGNAPGILDKDYTITAEVTIPKGGAEGMIVTLGGRFGGYGLFLQKGKPVFVYNLLDLERFRWEGGVGGRIGKDWFGKALKPGKHTLVFDFKYDGPGPGKGGTGVLSVDGKELARKTLKHTIPLVMTADETFDIGIDTRTGVDDSYELPFRFTGTIDKLTFKLGSSQLSESDKKAAEEAYVKVND